VEFHVLGPLEVLKEGQRVPLGGAKQRAALAMLLLHPNEVVSRDRLIDGLWGDEPPPSAAHTVEAYVSRLRAALNSDGEASRLVARAPGYLLRVERGELDLDRFKALSSEAGQAMSAGDAPAAASALCDALRLFRGAPLEDLAYAPFAQDEIGWLEELQTTALEQRIDADLACGRHAELIGELESLVARHRLRERFWAQLMLALYRSDRQGDALAAYERARRTLVEELGLEPGPTLAELQQRMLRHDPELAPASDRVAAATVSHPAASAGDAARPQPQVSHSGAGVVGREEREPRDALTRSRLRRRRVRVGVATGMAAILAAVLITVVLQDERSAGSAPRPGVNFLDARTGAVVGHLPVHITSMLEYVNGTFWELTGSETTASVSIRAIDARTHRTREEFPSPVEDVGYFVVDGDDLWVTDYRQPVLLRVDVRLGRVAQRIPLAHRIAEPREGSSYGAKKLVVADGSIWVGRTGEVVQVDPNAGKVVRRFPLPYQWGMAVGEGKVWVVTKDGVTWIDPRTHELGPTTPIGGADDVIAGAGFAWATDELGTVYKIGLDGRLLATYRTSQGVVGDTKLDLDEGTVWEGNESTGTVTAIDAVSGRRRTYRFPHAIGDLAAGAGVVAVPLSTEPSMDQVFAGVTGKVARFIWPSHTTDPGDPAIADIRLNPWMAQMERATCAMLLNYQDAAGPRVSQLEPELAASMPKISADGRTYRFTLRSGYRFAPPSNQPVTAEAVRYSIERALSPRLGSTTPGPQMIADIAGERSFRRGRARHIAGLKASGHQLTITLVKPSHDFLQRISLPFFAAVPAGTPIVPEGVDPPPPTAGPYYMALRNMGLYVILKRNPNYRGPRPHRFDAFILREGMDPGQAVDRVNEGTWDHVSLRDPLLAPGGAVDREWGAPAAASKNGARYIASPVPTVGYIAFNASRPLFSDPGMRVVAANALDRRTLARSRQQVAADQLLPPTVRAFRDRHLFPLGSAAHKPSKALGRPVMARATMAVQSGCHACVQVARAVQGQLATIGIRVRPREMPNASARALAQAPVDMVELRTTVPYADAASFLSSMFGTDIPAAWLPTVVRATVAHLRGLTGHARDAAAVRVADELATHQVPATAFGLGAMGELFAKRLGCIVDQPLGSGTDLAALCEKASR
jgi:DNA-binding SARP family transcriptional activator/ABC-type transport system substrate-binding protein